MKPPSHHFQTYSWKTLTDMEFALWQKSLTIFPVHQLKFKMPKLHKSSSQWCPWHGNKMMAVPGEEAKSRRVRAAHGAAAPNAGLTLLPSREAPCVLHTTCQENSIDRIFLLLTTQHRHSSCTANQCTGTAVWGIKQNIWRHMGLKRWFSDPSSDPQHHMKVRCSGPHL